jgi:DNA-binding NarL/FixJ family response regulator
MNDEFELIDLDEVQAFSEDVFVLASLKKPETSSFMDHVAQKFSNLTFSFCSADSVESVVLELPDVVVFETTVLDVLEDLNTVRKLRQLKPSVPVLILSDNDDAEFQVAFYQAGASVYSVTHRNIELFIAQIFGLQSLSKTGRLLEVRNNLLSDKLKKLGAKG